MLERIPARLADVTGETINHDQINVTGWVHSVTTSWEIDRNVYVIDITIDGERQEIELLNYTASPKGQK